MIDMQTTRKEAPVRCAVPLAQEEGLAGSGLNTIREGQRASVLVGYIRGICE